jgi:hypothetical protein
MSARGKIGQWRRVEALPIIPHFQRDLLRLLL